MPRLLLIFLLITVITFLLGRFSTRFWLRRASSKSKPAGAGDALVQDPNCLTYLSKKNALETRSGGATHYFCSPGCAEAFEKKRAEK